MLFFFLFLKTKLKLFINPDRTQNYFCNDQLHFDLCCKKMYPLCTTFCYVYFFPSAAMHIDHTCTHQACKDLIKTLHLFVCSQVTHCSVNSKSVLCVYVSGVNLIGCAEVQTRVVKFCVTHWLASIVFITHAKQTHTHSAVRT